MGGGLGVICMSAQVKPGKHTHTHTHSMSSLTAVLNSFRMTNLKGEASADGIWEEQDDAVRFQT